MPARTCGLFTRRRVVPQSRIFKVEVAIEPGTDWRYSGGVLQLLIKHMSGEPLEAYMQRSVVRALGTVHSAHHCLLAQGSTLVTFCGKDVQPATHFRFSAVAASSFYTSVSDITRFLQAYLRGNKRRPVGRSALALPTIVQMWHPTCSRYRQPIWGLDTMV